MKNLSTIFYVSFVFLFSIHVQDLDAKPTILVEGFRLSGVPLTTSDAEEYKGLSCSGSTFMM